MASSCASLVSERTFSLVSFNFWWALLFKFFDSVVRFIASTFASSTIFSALTLLFLAISFASLVALLSRRSDSNLLIFTCFSAPSSKSLIWDSVSIIEPYLWFNVVTSVSEFINFCSYVFNSFSKSLSRSTLCFNRDSISLRLLFDNHMKIKEIKK